MVEFATHLVARQLAKDVVNYKKRGNTQENQGHRWPGVLI